MMFAAYAACTVAIGGGGGDFSAAPFLFPGYQPGNGRKTRDNK
jgi:hypothetical protein